MDGPDIDDLDARLPVAVAERKVIEAAKSQLAVKDEAMPVWITATTKTERAVEALLAAEREGP